MIGELDDLIGSKIGRRIYNFRKKCHKIERKEEMKEWMNENKNELVKRKKNQYQEKKERKNRKEPITRKKERKKMGNLADNMNKINREKRKKIFMAAVSRLLVYTLSRQQVVWKTSGCLYCRSPFLLSKDRATVY